MPYVTARAECHPERQRKTADGLCDTCYRRERYQRDESMRAQRRRSSRAWQARQRCEGE